MLHFSSTVIHGCSTAIDSCCTPDSRPLSPGCSSLVPPNVLFAQPVAYTRGPSVLQTRENGQGISDLSRALGRWLVKEGSCRLLSQFAAAVWGWDLAGSLQDQPQLALQPMTLFLCLRRLSQYNRSACDPSHPAASGDRTLVPGVHPLQGHRLCIVQNTQTRPRGHHPGLQLGGGYHL